MSAEFLAKFLRVAKTESCLLQLLVATAANDAAIDTHALANATETPSV